MIRFRYQSVIHPQSLSDFRVSLMENNACLLVGVTGLNAKTFVNSKKWAELETLAGNQEDFSQKIEEICRLFTEHYQHTQRIRNGKNGIRSAGEIIESLAVILLQSDGKSYIYQAGKCSVAVLKHSGAHFPVSSETALSAIELRPDDRLVVDLQNADVVSSLRNFVSLQNPSDTLPEDVAGFNYPFVFTYALAEYVEDVIIQPAAGEPVVLELPEPEFPPVAMEITQEQVKEIVEAKPPASKKPSTKSGNPIWAGLFITLALGGAGVLGWEIFREEKKDPDTQAVVPVQPNVEKPYLPEKKVKSETGKALDILMTAQNAMRQADRSLVDGHNEKALAELARAEKIYEQYLSTHPTDTSSQIKLKINEIRQKKRLLKNTDNF